MLRAFSVFGRSSFAGEPPRRQFLPHAFLLELLSGAQARLEVLPAPDLPWELARRAHDPGYLERWQRGDVTRAEERALGFAWTPAVVERSLAACGATLCASWDALSSGIGINLGGGTHHASFARAEGFSFLNDVAICTRHVLEAGLVRRVLILDLDVHQGNGTAAMLRSETRAFTLSVHSANNYPFKKEQSRLDLALPDGTGDEAYLELLLGQVLPAVSAFQPELVYYLAGADVLAGDQLGRLGLSLAGLRRREDEVYGWAARSTTPLVSLMAGGYHRDPATLIQARLGTLDAALQAFGRAILPG